jgi:hypothetical protein
MDNQEDWAICEMLIEMALEELFANPPTDPMQEPWGGKFSVRASQRVDQRFVAKLGHT